VKRIVVGPVCETASDLMEHALSVQIEEISAFLRRIPGVRQRTVDAVRRGLRRFFPRAAAVAVAIGDLVVFAVGLADAGRGLRFPFMVHATPLRADLPVSVFNA
jgi:hypothetical protein